MKFRDHRTGFDTVMFAGDNADGHLSLSLNYRVPRLEAVIELSRSDARALGVYLLQKFSAGDERRRLDEALEGLDALGPGAADAARTGVDLADRHAGQFAGIGVDGIMDALKSGDKIGNSWYGRIAAGIAGAQPGLPKMADGLTEMIDRITLGPRPPYWRRVWNALRGR